MTVVSVLLGAIYFSDVGLLARRSMITPFFKERSGRVGMTVVSVLLGAAVEVGVGSKPTFAK